MHEQAHVHNFCCCYIQMQTNPVYRLENLARRREDALEHYQNEYNRQHPSGSSSPNILQPGEGYDEID